jgi:hypothetical protein
MSDDNILKQIYKFEVPLKKDGFVVQVPEGSSLLSWLPILEKGIMKVWFLCNPNNPLVERIFNIKKKEEIENED